MLYFAAALAVRSRCRLEGSGCAALTGQAVYFAKYGTAGPKEYQHRVPREWIDCYLICDDCGCDYPEDHDECPDCGCYEAEVVEVGSAGRFWGYRGLRPVLAARQVTPADGIRAGRILRRWYKAKGLTKRVLRPRVDQATGRLHHRATTLRRSCSETTAGSSPSTTALRWPRNSPAIS